MNPRFIQLFVLLSCLCFLPLACNKRVEPVKSTPPDLTGFWKTRCSNAFGVQIKKQTADLYSVSFCGPGGCFEPNTWEPNTPIIGDPNYRLVNPATLALLRGDTWQTYTKCTTEANPKLDYATMPGESSSTKQTDTAPAVAPESPPYVVQEAPALPFLDWDACPFEGYTYREWTAAAPVEVFDTWEPNRKLIATLPTNSVVTGLTGVVITSKPGTIRLNADLSQDDLHRGDTILTYTYRGEGFSAVWFKGRFYHDYDITFAKWPDGSGCLGSDCAGTYVDLGEKVWWAKVKMSSGIVGWVNMDKAKLGGVDQFALATEKRDRQCG